MNQFSHDDPDLKNFLQQHRHPVPSASSELEDQILQAIESSKHLTAYGPSRPLPLRRSRSYVWFVSGSIAATLIAGLVSYRFLLPTQPTTADLASLEDFIETNWQSTVNGSVDTANGTADMELLPVADSTVN